MNELTTQQHDANPFNRAVAVGQGGNIGAIEIESQRAIAEAQGQLVLAKRFPRSMAAATADFLESCKSIEFAEEAFYSVPNRGSGPSIRFAEEAARCYGNFIYGHKELSRTQGKSEIEVYAWDMEKNNRSTRQITVMHVLDSRNGTRPLTDQADIDNKIANVASKQMRGRILALLPKAMVAAGEAMAKRTLAGGNDKPMAERVNTMVSAFGSYGVNSKLLEKYLGHSLDNTTVEELADLKGIYNALKQGGKASDYFNADDSGAEKSEATAKAITDASKKQPATQSTAKPAASKTVKDQKQSAEEKPAEAKQEVKEAKSEPAAAAPAPEPEPEAQEQPAPAAQPAPPEGEEEEVF